MGFQFLLAENTIKTVVSAFCQTGKNTPKLAKMLSQNLVQVESKLGPRMLRNKIGPSFDSRKCICFFRFARFSLKSHSPCTKKNIFEQKKHKKRNSREKLDQALTQKKAFFGPSFDSTACNYYKNNSTQIVKPLSRPLTKMALLQPKVPFWVFPCACWNPYFYSVLSLGMATHNRTIFQKQIVATKMRVFLPSEHK